MWRFNMRLVTIRCMHPILWLIILNEEHNQNRLNHCAPVYVAVDVQVKPWIVHYEECLQNHKSNIHKVDDIIPALPACAIIVPLCNQLDCEECEVAEAKDHYCCSYYSRCKTLEERVHLNSEACSSHTILLTLSFSTTLALDFHVPDFLTVTCW